MSVCVCVWGGGGGGEGRGGEDMVSKRKAISKSKYIKRVHSVKIQRHTNSRANVMTRHQKQQYINIKKKLNMQQPVPSRRFQYKTIGKMQFKMQKMVLLRNPRLLSFNLGWIFQE